MKYILAICNLFGVLFLGFILIVTNKHIVTMDANYEAFVNKYRTENATELAYICEVYHFGEWATALTDALAIQAGLGLSDESRVRAASNLGTAIAFEETFCSYLTAFEETVTAVLSPYRLAVSQDYILLTDITMTGGTLIGRNLNSTLSLNTKEELMSAYRTVCAIGINVPDNSVWQSMQFAMADCVNAIVSESIGASAFAEKDSIHVPVFKDNLLFGINPITNQTLIVLNGTDNGMGSTTLAGYTKTAKRFYCSISGPAGIFYCYSDELPNNYVVLATHNSELEAASAPGVIGRYYVGH